MTSQIKHYLKTIEADLQRGRATEHTHRPTLQALLEAIDLSIKATNEPKRSKYGAPDYVITTTADNLTIGYIEAKDVGIALDRTERDEQLKRYRRSLDNLLLTDYLEFRWYVEGQPRQSARLAQPDPRTGQLKSSQSGRTEVLALLQAFLSHQPQQVNTPTDLAKRMARLTHMIRDIIIATFENEAASTLLRDWRRAFAEVLIADLDLPEKTAEFADMFAQTLAYGLFTARVMDPTPATFSRAEAQRLIPRSNPFLRDFFARITGIDLDDEPFAPFVEDLVNLLAHTDMAAILTDFGRRTRQEDPVVHFYETFLAAYDPRLRESRGVYYTPEPVVSYIVRSVDHLLKSRFNCPQGLADSSLVSVPNYDPSLKVKGKNEMRKTTDSHKVLILDPATGTGTFLYAVIDHIRQQFIDQGNAGMWPGYVKHHLLPRLFGFELLMAPYAVAHFKLSMQLAGQDLPEPLRAQWAYQPDDNERLGIYLTNTLEEAHEMTGLPLFTQAVADETNAANEIKRHLPIMVVMGNPPYSGHSSNKGQWINDLLKGKLPDGGKTANYYEVDGKPLGERNPKWLRDDYVKFIRFAQWRIERSGQGILAFISNNGYLDSPTFRGMRQQLMQSFDEIYILNLHGNSKKKETAPDGSPDVNVFDIQQGVGIGIFVKQPGKSESAKIFHADLWGIREKKYEYLLSEDVKTTTWELLRPQAPFYLFVPQDISVLDEYKKNRQITEIVPVNVLGFQTHRDKFAVDFDYNQLHSRIKEMRELSVTDEDYRRKYDLKDNRDWQLTKARIDLRNMNDWEYNLIKCDYRPFDQRYCFFDEAASDYPRRELKDHVAGKRNLCINTVRQTKYPNWQHALISDSPTPAVFIEIKDGSSAFPLYLYPSANQTKQQNLLDTTPWPPGENGRVPNLDPDFVAELEQRLGLKFLPSPTGRGVGGEGETFGPEDIFHYIYAIFHSPTYRQRYAEFLKIDFPRVPLTSDVALFRSLAGLGAELTALHLLESPTVGRLLTRFPAPGDNFVERGYPKYTPPGEAQPGRVWINKSQYFEGVPPEVWAFHIGGYQVCDKWLKDRRGRQLSYDDLTHYQQTIVALNETIRLMAEIDATIPEWPLA